MKAVGILGGTFDPIHHGHLITARAVAEKRDLEKIILIPANISPHKLNEEHTDPTHRFNMLDLAIRNEPLFECSDYEVGKGDISYTIETIKEMKKHYSNLELIIGYDNLVKFDKWHKPEEIVSLVKLIVMKREMDKEINIEHKFAAKAQIIDTPTIEISATDIRQRVRGDLSIEYLVTKEVKEYIYKNKLYRN